jgi:hypothetical protein
MTANKVLASSIFLAIRPTWSWVHHIPLIPPRLTIPLVGRKSTRLQADTELRIYISKSPTSQYKLHNISSDSYHCEICSNTCCYSIGRFSWLSSEIVRVMDFSAQRRRRNSVRCEFIEIVLVGHFGLFLGLSLLRRGVSERQLTSLLDCNWPLPLDQ